MQVTLDRRHLLALASGLVLGLATGCVRSASSSSTQVVVSLRRGAGSSPKREERYHLPSLTGRLRLYDQDRVLRAELPVGEDGAWNPAADPMGSIAGITRTTSGDPKAPDQLDVAIDLAPGTAAGWWLLLDSGNDIDARPVMA